jgi:hypothetical protein
VIAAGAHLGLKPGLAAKYMNLTKLPDQVQEAILEGKANNCSINVIEQIAIKEKPELMFEKFAEHVELLAFLISIDRFHSWLLICI